MRILVDIDGVLAEQVSPALDRYNAAHGANVLRSDIVTYNEPVDNTDIGAIIASVDVRDCPLIAGAREAMVQLCRRHHVMIVTARPVALMEPTEAWLVHNRIPYHSWMSTKDKSDAPGDVLIDDYTGHVAAFAAKGKRAILFDQPWNERDRVPHGAVRCCGWGDVLKQIENWEVNP